MRSKKLSIPGTYELFYPQSDFWEEQATYYSVSDRYVLTLRLRPEFARSLETSYAKSNTSRKLEIASIVDITSRHTRIAVSIEHNSKKVAQLRGRFHRYFNVGRKS